MCGVVGYFPKFVVADQLMEDERRSAFNRLFYESRIRGHHAYGIAQPDDIGQGINWYKTGEPFSHLVKNHLNTTLPAIAHTRYCQSGDWHVVENNQPLVVRSMALAMNGVIHMGTKEEFELEFGVKCEADNDSEVFLQQIASAPDSETMLRQASEALRALRGAFAGVWLAYGRLFVGRNARRPLWWVDHLGARWFASTADIFRRAGFPEATPVQEGVYDCQAL